MYLLLLFLSVFLGNLTHYGYDDEYEAVIIVDRTTFSYQFGWLICHIANFSICNIVKT